MSDAVAEAKRVLADMGDPRKALIKRIYDALANLLDHVERPTGDAEVERVCFNLAEARKWLGLDHNVRAIDEAAALLRSLAAQCADARGERDSFMKSYGESLDMREAMKAELARLTDGRAGTGKYHEAMNDLCRAIWPEHPMAASMYSDADIISNAARRIARLTAPVTDKKRAELVARLRERMGTYSDCDVKTRGALNEAAAILEADARWREQVRREIEALHEQSHVSIGAVLKRVLAILDKVGNAPEVEDARP